MNTQLDHEYGVSPEAGTLRLERTLPGPIERVWAYLTESEKRGKWFASGPMELKPGGKITFHFHHSQLAPDSGPPPEKYKDCEGMTSYGRVIRCEPPHLLSFMWGEEQGDESEVTFELSDRNGDVLLVLTHRWLVLPADGMFMWEFLLTCLTAASRSHFGLSSKFWKPSTISGCRRQNNHPRFKIAVATWRATAMIVQDGFTPGAVGNKLESAT
jgi:uncharacterized protein YndB with AHSA1/START domain